VEPVVDRSAAKFVNRLLIASIVALALGLPWPGHAQTAGGIWIRGAAGGSDAGEAARAPILGILRAPIHGGPSMRSGSNRPRALAGAALLVLGLCACHFERNVADGCWIDQKANADALAFQNGLRLRNVPKSDAAWSVAQDRITRSRTALQACQDGLPGSGRPPTPTAGADDEASAGEHGA